MESFKFYLRFSVHIVYFRLNRTSPLYVFYRKKFVCCCIRWKDLPMTKFSILRASRSRLTNFLSFTHYLLVSWIVLDESTGKIGCTSTF